MRTNRSNVPRYHSRHCCTHRPEQRGHTADFDFNLPADVLHLFHQSAERVGKRPDESGHPAQEPARRRTYSWTSHHCHSKNRGLGLTTGVNGQIDIFLFPLLATWLESKVYGVHPPDYISFFRRKILRKGYPEDPALSESTAVKIDHIRKEYSTKFLGVFGRKKPVVAIEDLSFSIPKGEIFCLVCDCLVVLYTADG
jgi:ABC-type glutathione transport system ATPase component